MEVPNKHCIALRISVAGFCWPVLNVDGCVKKQKLSTTARQGRSSATECKVVKCPHYVLYPCSYLSPVIFL